ncbi:MAG: PLP-dependent aminotransferase family protein [Holophagales bacterium]|jgi:GntR family transcriptional regulator/MocR family aminotransferase|nr:PLP-dependent aminotransferase family protein [Holophagales bacterium]
MRTLEGLWLDRTSRVTLQEQLARQIKELIQSGVLAPGDALPSTRDVATGLNISRNTAVNAFDRLLSEGYVESVARSGLFVSSSITLSPHSTWQVRPKAGRGRTLAPAPSRPTPLGAPLPFRPSQPDVALFPLLIWNRMRARALRLEGRSLLRYQAPCVAGLPALRQNVAAYLRDSRGVRCDWRQVVITSGSQQALFLLGMLLLGPRDLVYVEDPGYLEARLAWRRAGAKVIPGPLDEQGLRLPARPVGKVSLVYTTPSRQFPTGVSLSLARRLALIDYAGRTGAWVIEDDYDSELRYGAPPLPSLQSLDRSGRVIYVGTFSKLLFPSLRLGYVVVPEPLLETFVELKHLIDDHLPLVDQATLALFLESGAFYSHIRRCRKAYAERQALFLGLFADSKLPIAFPHADGGMNLTGILPDDRNDEALSRRLGEAGFDVPALSRYAVRASPPGLVFGFTAFTPPEIRSAFARMRPELDAALG